MKIEREGNIVVNIAIALGIALIIVLTLASKAKADEIDDIVPAIIQVESGGNPRAVSPCGAIGLMQVTPIVLQEYKNWVGCEWSEKHHARGVCNWTMRDLYDPVNNRALGTWYLHYIKVKYLKKNYTLERLLCCYNGGYGRLKKVDFDINRMPRESREYVHKVMKLYKESKHEPKI